ncbi:unnamed protein product [Caenorhabditis auriculariae]|uniref:Transmembrane protein 177 n=1 Tax=Caenorhabditis auriculariae TaxID=2777116 RepID=A0A8S1GRG3_9PELO|nr:unnamed protein product [Caenorhabditis auriculariae]
MGVYSDWNNRATVWLQKTPGRRFRIGLLAATVVTYPVGSILINGPLSKFTFPKRHSIEKLPESLARLADQEYRRFLEKENRIPKDAVINHHIQSTFEDEDTIASGSLGIRTGLNIAVPFYARFQSTENALEYFREKYADTMDFLSEKVRVPWSSGEPSSSELAESYVLSENALRFLFLRDLYAHDGYASLAQRSISWATWTSFTSIFTYWLHSKTKLGGGTAMSFAVIYTVFVGAAYYANKQWYLLYRYLSDVHADAEAARTSFDHAEGGKEYYWKMLKRNRIYRELKPSLFTKVTATGDVRGIATPIIVRYDHLKDVNAEDDELRQVINMDD